MYLLLRLQGRPFALPALDTLEMVHGARVAISRVTGAGSAILGVFDHRGGLLPIIDLRAVMGLPSFATEVDELRATLVARERDHVQWLAELERCATSGEPFTKATDPHLCAFGKWYDALRSDPAALSSFTGERVALHAAVQALDAPHRAIHGIAGRVLDLAAAGDAPRATALIREAEHTHLGQLRRALTELLELFVQQRQVMLVVVQASPKNVAFGVDEVLAVQELDADKIDPVPPSVRVPAAITGLYRPEQGPVVQILDPKRVIEALLGVDAA